MTENNNYEFWIKYFKANEVERLNILKSLPIFTGMKDNAWLGTISPTLLNSYIEDIIESYEAYISGY